MNKEERVAMQGFFKESVKTCDSMIIIAIKDGNLIYSISANSQEVCYMSEVVKQAVLMGTTKEGLQ